MAAIIDVNPINGQTINTPSPFLFAVHHKDDYPEGDDQMQAPRLGNGNDFDGAMGPNGGKWRMYHGDRIPGFPQHPHRGFETVTATIEGLVDHADSCGNGGRYGNGDLQWMTAGKGVVHGEMFPLLNTDKPNPCRFLQIWLNLPAKNKMVEPAFAMHWAEEIPTVTTEDGKGEFTVYAGSLLGKAGGSPPPDSWAADPCNEVGVWLLRLQPGGIAVLPAAKSSEVNRLAANLDDLELEIDGKRVTSSEVRLRPQVEVTVHNPASSGKPAELLILSGKPIDEPVAQRGPFVMNTDEELFQAFVDYRKTRFGGWPWPEDAMVFPRNKGRFSLLDGKETYPPPQPAA